MRTWWGGGWLSVDGALGWRRRRGLRGGGGGGGGAWNVLLLLAVLGGGLLPAEPAAAGAAAVGVDAVPPAPHTVSHSANTADRGLITGCGADCLCACSALHAARRHDRRGAVDRHRRRDAAAAAAATIRMAGVVEWPQLIIAAHRLLAGHAKCRCNASSSVSSWALLLVFPAVVDPWP